MSYIDPDTKIYLEFYCVINTVADEYYYFTITEWLKGNENNVYQEDIQMSWSLSEMNAAYINEMGDEDLKEISRCTKCGRKANFIKMALCCKIHGFTKQGC